MILTLKDIHELGTGTEMFATRSKLRSSSSKIRVYEFFDTKLPTTNSWVAA